MPSPHRQICLLLQQVSSAGWLLHQYNITMVDFNNIISTNAYCMCRRQNYFCWISPKISPRPAFAVWRRCLWKHSVHYFTIFLFLNILRQDISRAAYKTWSPLQHTSTFWFDRLSQPLLTFRGSLKDATSELDQQYDNRMFSAGLAQQNYVFSQHTDAWACNYLAVHIYI